MTDNEHLPTPGMAFRYMGSVDKEKLEHCIHYFAGKDPIGSSWIFVAYTPGRAFVHWHGFPCDYIRWPEKDREDLKQVNEDLEKVADVQKCMDETRALTVDADRRVVCAANRFPNGLIVAGVRHFCPIMRMQLAHMPAITNYHVAEQGFIDQWGNFLTRQEAYVIAERQGQYRPYPPYVPGTLYSEDLY